MKPKNHRIVVILMSAIALATSFAGADSLETWIELVSPNEEIDGHFGFAVSGVPDLDGDGRGDVIVAANQEDPGTSPYNAGRVYIFSGATGALLHTLVSPNEEYEGSFGCEWGSGVGWDGVSGIPDVDGDGRGDVIVSATGEAPGSSPSHAGRAYVFSGSTGALLHTLVSPNEETSGRFGISVSGIPDVDGDGRGDVIVGADQEDPGSSPNSAGRAYIFSGATRTLLHTLVSPNEVVDGCFGGAVSGTGDVDGDGRGDVIVGARDENPGASPDYAGRAYIFSGATGALLHTLVSPNEQDGGMFGFRLSDIPDVDGDGRDDVVVGESLGTVGCASIFSGATGTLLRTLVSPWGEIHDWGYDVFGIPDVNGDDRGDVTFGDPSWSSEVGSKAIIFSGATGALLFTLEEEVVNSFFGCSVSEVQDVNGDGRGDVIVGAHDEGTGGRAYIFLNELPMAVPGWELYQ